MRHLWYFRTAPTHMLTDNENFYSLLDTSRLLPDAHADGREDLGAPEGPGHSGMAGGEEKERRHPPDRLLLPREL